MKKLKYFNILIILLLLFTLSCEKKEVTTIDTDFQEIREQFFKYLSVNDLKSAEDLLKKQLLKWPNDASILDLMGNLRFTAGDIDSAMEYYNKAIRVNPGYAHTYFDRGSLYLIQEKYDLALIDLKKAVEIDPDYHDFQLALGSAYLTIGNINESIIHLSKAVKIDQNSIPAKFSLGMAYFEKGEDEKAGELFFWIIKNHPNSDEAQLLKELIGY